GGERPPPARERMKGVRLMSGATVGAVLIGVVVAVGAGPLARLSERAAVDLLERSTYQEAVLGDSGGRAG
ncbi:Na+/H+ antiporter subunit D, partial [Streptomyces sp. CNQ085]|nr:Na+/H+ antiporter subunit D [Streptomyces sp. CNQ085]